MPTVLVTGANSGIGRAAAVRLAAAGYRVYGGMRDPSKGGKLLELAAKQSCEVEPLALDVTEAASVQSALERIARESDGVEVLINNAGIAWNATTEDVDIEAAKIVFETNYWGAMRLIQGVLPGMRERRAGQIVNVSSVAGRFAALGQVVYASSKWAVECMSEALAQEVAPFDIRVCVIEPGVTRTAILPKNVAYPTPTAYETAYRRMLQFYLKGIQADVQADEVALTILRALEDPARSFRYVCAYGGAEITSGRARIPDQSWIDLGRHETDEAYYADFERLFGLDLRTAE